MHRPTITCAFLAAVLTGSAAHAEVITLSAGRPYADYYDFGGMGSGRGFGLQVDASFELRALALDLGIQETNDTLYVFEVFGSNDGHLATGQRLASTAPFTLNAGTGYQDQPLQFSFAAGSAYVINFRRMDGEGLGNLGTRYSWEDPGSFVPHDYGTLRIVEGFEGARPDPSNPLIPHARLWFDSDPAPVPEPSSVLLLLTGGALIGRRVWSRVRAGQGPTTEPERGADAR